MSWGAGSWSDGWDKGTWKWPGEASPTSKDPADWSKYTYLNGGPKASHTVPSDQRAWLIREMMSRVQEDDDDKVKIPVLKTLRWNVNTLDGVISIFCGIGRRMAIVSLGKSREAVLTACVEGFQTKFPDADDRRQVMVKVMELADREEALLEMAVEDGFNFEPEALPSTARAAPPSAASRSATAPGAGTRVLQRQSTTELLEQLEKRRRVANMEKEAAMAEQAAMAARHAAANGRLWQGQVQGTTLVQGTPAAPPTGALASVDHALFGTGMAAGAGPPAVAAPTGFEAAAHGATAATAAAPTGVVAAAPGAAAAAGQPQAVAGQDAIEQAKQAAMRARQTLLSRTEPSAQGEQPASSTGAGQGVGSRPSSQGNSQQGQQAQTVVDKMAELAEELMQKTALADAATEEVEQMKAKVEEASCAQSEAKKHEQEAMRMLGEARAGEEEALRTQAMNLRGEAGAEEEAIRSRALEQQSNLEAKCAESDANLHKWEQAARDAEAKCAESDANSRKWEQAARDAEIRHVSEMKDFEMQAQSYKHEFSMQEVSLKAEVTQLRTELQNAEREASLHKEMQSMEMQAEQARCSSLQAELEEAKNSDE